jgi:hypothetical protein
MKMNIRKNCPSKFKSEEEMTELDDMIHNLHDDERVKEFRKIYKIKLFLKLIFFCKNLICTHSLAFSHLKDLSWFGPKYSKYSKEFV